MNRCCRTAILFALLLGLPVPPAAAASAADTAPAVAPSRPAEGRATQGNPDLPDTGAARLQSRPATVGGNGQSIPGAAGLVEHYRQEIVMLGILLAAALILGLYLFSLQLRRGIEKRTAELAAVTSEYKDILDHMQDIYFRTNLEGELIWVSLACERILGFQREELLGRQMNRLFLSENERDHFLKALEANNGDLQRYELRLAHKEGSAIWTEVNAQYYRHEENVIAGVEGNVRNISERKAAEQKSRELTGQLQQAQKMESIGVLAGGIAHDFNNLLVGVMGNAELAMLDTPEEVEAYQYLQQILKASRRGADLVGQILAYSGQGCFAMGQQNINALVLDISGLLGTAIGKQAKLELQLMDELPFVYGDKNQLAQLIMNLMTNASEALRGTPGSIQLRTGVRQLGEDDFSRMYMSTDLQEDEYVFVEVSDNGCGMDEKTQKRIFDPFFTTKENGTGLGLAALLGIVHGHKGTLALQSAPGQGSCFTVYIPLAPAAKAEHPVRSIPTTEETPLAPATVLIVDDEEAVRKVASGFLTHAGLNVLTASDGEECIELFRRHAEKIALVVLDLTMPGINGEQAFHAIHAIRPSVPVLLSSGFSESEAINRLGNRGMAGFIHKPYSRKSFIDEIRRHLSG